MANNGVKLFSPLWTDKTLTSMFERERVLFTSRGRYMICNKCHGFFPADTRMFRHQPKNGSGLRHECRHCFKRRATELRGRAAAKREEVVNYA